MRIKVSFDYRRRRIRTNSYTPLLELMAAMKCSVSPMKGNPLFPGGMPTELDLLFLRQNV